MSEDIFECIIYGAGNMCRLLLDLISETDIHVICIVDGNETLWGSCVNGVTVKSPDVLYDLSIYPVCIAIDSYNVMIDVLKKMKKEYKINHEIYYWDLVTKIISSKINDTEFKVDNTSFSVSKIVFDCIVGLGLGGIESWTIGLCREIMNRNLFDVNILTDSGQYDVDDDIRSIINHIDIEYVRDGYSLNGINKVFKYFEKIGKFTIVTSHINIVMIAACLYKIKYPDAIRIISVIHCGQEKEYLQNKAVAKFIDRFVSVSVDITEGMRAGGISADKIDNITCPFECDETLNRNYTLNPSEKIQLGYAGRIEIIEKRFDLIYKLILELEKRNVNYCFNIIGDGSQKDNLKEFIISNNLENKVILKNSIPRKDISTFWKTQDIYINISEFEGHSLSQMEAMANGVVPVTSFVSGVKEDIIMNYNGFYFDCGDYLKAVEYIEYLADNRELIPKLGKSAHKVMYPKSSLEAHVCKWIEIINKLT